MAGAVVFLGGIEYVGYIYLFLLSLLCCCYVRYYYKNVRLFGVILGFSSEFAGVFLVLFIICDDSIRYLLF